MLNDVDQDEVHHRHTLYILHNRRLINHPIVSLLDSRLPDIFHFLADIRDYLMYDDSQGFLVHIQSRHLMQKTE